MKKYQEYRATQWQGLLLETWVDDAGHRVQKITNGLKGGPESPESIPEGCIACGGQNGYVECRLSCPIWEDNTISKAVQ